MKARITVTQITGKIAGTTTVYADHSVVYEDGHEAIGLLARHPDLDKPHLDELNADGQAIAAQHGFTVVTHTPLTLERHVADHREANHLFQSMLKAANHEKYVAHHDRRRKAHGHK